MNWIAAAQLLLGLITTHQAAGQPAPPAATAGLAKILDYYAEFQKLVAGLVPPTNLVNIEKDIAAILAALKAENITVGGAQPFLDGLEKIAQSKANLEAGQWAEAFEFTEKGRVGVIGAMFKDGPAYKSITEGPEESVPGKVPL